MTTLGQRPDTVRLENETILNLIDKSGRLGQPCYTETIAGRVGVTRAQAHDVLMTMHRRGLIWYEVTERRSRTGSRTLYRTMRWRLKAGWRERA